MIGVAGGLVGSCKAYFAAPTEQTVYARDLGVDWPLTCDWVTVKIDPSKEIVWMETPAGREYALTGMAEAYGYRELDYDTNRLWERGMNLGPLIDIGLDLLDQHK